MKKARKMCYDKILPQDLHREQRVRSMGSNGRVRAIAVASKRWVNGSTIKIRFMGGTAAQQDMVKNFAPEWTNHANLEFVFTDDPNAQIRITFDPNDGAWSYLGTDNLNIPIHAATMNLGWQDEGVILHEFGHMIGLGHEHQNPDGGILWNEAVVIAELGGPPNFWNPETVRHNVLNKYEADQSIGTEFDKKSIMLYEFPVEWTTNGIETHANEKLSDIDKAFIKSAEMYPGTGAPGARAVELTVAVALQADISSAGEEDLYKFSVNNSGVHTVETLGSTDVVMSLYGPDDSTMLVGEDDDGGTGRNARIVADLEEGTYLAHIRHFNENQMGDYKILVHH